MIRRASEQDFIFQANLSGPATFNVEDLTRNLESSTRERRELRAARSSEKVTLDEKKFRKLAFDLYESRNGDRGVWKAEQDESGHRWLVRTQGEFFEKESTEVPKSIKLGNWEAHYDAEKEGVVLAYAGQALKGFLASKYQFDRSSAPDFMNFLLKKASTSPTLIQELSPKMSNDAIRAVMRTLDLTKSGDKSRYASLKSELSRRGELSEGE